MSNALAVAAVTATLQNLLVKQLPLPEDKVTIKPLDMARPPNGTTEQVNLFLYHVTYDAAWLNMNMPNKIKPNETGFPPLPLVLHYLITAYGNDSSTPESHILLGRAMSVLHDHPLLGAAEIKAAFTTSDLSEQIERVRITPQPLSMDEMSKLWTTFQTNYRISAAYQVSVVLIESTRAVRAPLPVLTRGKMDSGIQSQPNLTPPSPTSPTLTAVTLPKKQPSARLGDTITLEGFHLDGDTVTPQFKHPRLKDFPPVDPPRKVTATSMTVRIPDDAPEKWASGVYTVSLLIKSANKPDRVTNEFPFSLAPVITSDPLPLKVTRVGKDATVELKCQPLVLPEQPAFLLLSDKEARQVTAEPHPTQTDLLKFIIKDATVNAEEGFYMRLRIDGIDSLLVVDYEAKLPEFDQNQKVIIK